MTMTITVTWDFPKDKTGGWKGIILCCVCVCFLLDDVEVEFVSIVFVLCVCVCVSSMFGGDGKRRRCYNIQSEALDALVKK